MTLPQASAAVIVSKEREVKPFFKSFGVKVCFLSLYLFPQTVFNVSTRNRLLQPQHIADNGPDKVLTGILGRSPPKRPKARASISCCG